jgi:hypothetical protein
VNKPVFKIIFTTLWEGRRGDLEGVIGWVEFKIGLHTFPLVVIWNYKIVI